MKKELAFNQLNKMLEDLKTVDLFPSLVWLWTWDIIVNFTQSDDFQFNGTLENIWERIWDQIDELDWSLTYGDEQLYEQIRDWLIEEGFLIDIYDVEEEDGND